MLVRTTNMCHYVVAYTLDYGAHIMPHAVGPLTSAGQATLSFKYAQPGEGWREVSNRVASTLCGDDGPVEGFFHKFRDMMLEMRFIPGGRILAGTGTTKLVTLANCFVSGTIADSLWNAPGSIMQRLVEATRTLQMGGGIGYDFSTIRPSRDLVRSLGSMASGPVSYIELFSAMGKTIASYGERRGAQMGILRVDHPDIELFIYAKQNTDRITSFNLSIGITDSFINALRSGEDFPLQFEGRVYRKVNPRALWELIMRSTWDWAEPGVVFIDRMNDLNNLKYCETIAATNPCSEQPLPPYGACVLGAFNLARYVIPAASPTLLEGRYQFDWSQFLKDIPVAVRAMDRVFDVSEWPLPEQAEEAKNKRRIGIGVMGMANCVEAMGAAYGSPRAVDIASSIMKMLANESYFASSCLADERGRFPAYDGRYLHSKFLHQAISPAVRGRIAQSGMRNSHLITIAPTGTTAFMADNVSSGIEPVFATREDRNVETPDGTQVMEVEDYGSKFLGIVPRTSSQVTPKEHIAMLCAVQRYVDSAVSKTCNVPSETPWEDFKQIYLDAYDGGAKGCSTFQIAGKRAGIRQAAAECEGPTCQIA